MMTKKPKRELYIMLVEDDPAHAEITLRTLKGSPVNSVLLLFSDGQEALDYMEKVHSGDDSCVRPDIILLDLRLPKIDGIDFLRAIKANNEHRSIPIIVLTTSEAESDINKAYSNGAASYLVKPLNYEKYLGLLDNFGFYWLVSNKYPFNKGEYL